VTWQIFRLAPAFSEMVSARSPQEIQCAFLLTRAVGVVGQGFVRKSQLMLAGKGHIEHARVQAGASGSWDALVGGQAGDLMGELDRHVRASDQEPLLHQFSKRRLERIDLQACNLAKDERRKAHADHARAVQQPPGVSRKLVHP
jgi:hypothetical protein